MATLCISLAAPAAPDVMIDADSTSTLTFGQGVCCDMHTGKRLAADSKSPAPTTSKSCKRRRPGQTTFKVGGALMAVAGEEEVTRARAGRAAAAAAAAAAAFKMLEEMEGGEDEGGEEDEEGEEDEGG